MVSDEQLICRMSDGDGTALAEFYDQYAPQVLGLLVRMLPTRSDADDVLQEVFWQLWNSAGRYDAGRGSPKGWLFMMARSRALDSLRRLKTNFVASEAPDVPIWNPPTSDLERLESSEQVRQALSELTDEQRQAINLSFYGGLTHQEIAEHLELPLGTVKTRIRLGMKRLRGLLDDAASDHAPLVGRGLR